MEIRAAQPGDAQRLSALALAAKAHWEYDAEMLAAWRAQLAISTSDILAHPTYMAVASDEVAGFYMLKGGPRQWTLEHLWVDPSWMRQGIGMQLVQHALDVAARGGAHSVLVAADPNASGFYAHAGGVRCGATPAPIPGEPARALPLYQFPISASR